MKHEISTTTPDFESMCHVDEETGEKYWMARDIQPLLGYAKWQRFEQVIERAKTSCKTAGYDIEDHFTGSGKMVSIGSGSQREKADIRLTRYACYLIAMNGDPSKPQIAFAQQYFVDKTRKMEVIEKRLNESEVSRVAMRQKLATSEKGFSGVLMDRLHDGRAIGRIRSKGDEKFFGYPTRIVKQRMGIPENRPLGDFVHDAVVAIKESASRLTTLVIEHLDLRTETSITDEHSKINAEMRQMLVSRGIKPEDLPPQEDVKKVQRRIASEQRRIGHN